MSFWGTTKRGVMRESNSRPPAPKAGIIPLDQSPSTLTPYEHQPITTTHSTQRTETHGTTHARAHGELTHRRHVASVTLSASLKFSPDSTASVFQGVFKTRNIALIWFLHRSSVTLATIGFRFGPARSLSQCVTKHPDLAGHVCLVWPGLAWLARPGLAWPGLARPGLARMALPWLTATVPLRS